MAAPVDRLRHGPGRKSGRQNRIHFRVRAVPSCHASTIAETKSGLVAAWFGGTAERNPDVGIWVSRSENGRWATPVEVADGVGFATNRLPTWNPVLFQPRTGPLMLFYKVGPSPSTWWGMLTTSDDAGKTWSKPHRLPGRHSRPDQKQTRAARERRYSLPQQHRRRRRLAGALRTHQ